MYIALLGLLVLDGLFLAVVILLQSGKGGGLAAMGGGAAATDVLGGRQATTLLTRATWGAGSAFMVLSLVLAIMSSRTAAPTSVLEGLGEPATTVPEPVLTEITSPDGATDAAPEDAAAPPVQIIPPDGASEPPPETPPEGNEPPPDTPPEGNEPPEGNPPPPGSAPPEAPSR